jgi:hypothetical protein
VLRGRAAIRALGTEAAVVAGDAILSRDLAGLRGRLSGWGSARGQPHRAAIADALDGDISVRESFALRRGIYAPR